MYTYEEIGLMSPSGWLRDAYQNCYIIPAFNFVSLEQLLAIAAACAQMRSPVILQCSAGTRKFLHPAVVRRLVQGVAEMCAALGTPLHAALHLDHGTTYEECAACISEGFSSVMIDGSALPFEENIAITREVVAYAHPRGVTVEAELGSLKGQEEAGSEQGVQRFTDPDQAAEFVRRTDVDMLAVSIGTCHGAVKLLRLPDGSLPKLRADIIRGIEAKLPGFPLVLHGASSLPRRYVDMINENGGHVEEAQGIPTEEIVRLLGSAVCKVNNASDGWIASVAATRKALAKHPGTIDPRTYLKPVRDEMVELYTHKVCTLFKSAGRV